MGNCIAFAGCQAEHHIPSCAKFDQRTEDIYRIRQAIWASAGEYDYGPEDAMAAFDRLIGENS